MNMQMWHMEPLESCRKFDIYTTTCSGTLASRYHERVAYVLGPDEPDAKDNRGGGAHRQGLGYHARELADSGWQEKLIRLVPHVASWIIMNGTTRPLNWSVYGQFADISCFDPYPVMYYGCDHAYVRESLSVARLSGAPSRMFGCMEAAGWAPSLGIPKGARGPTPEEYRQNIVQAIGSGMKGLTSWVYHADGGGWDRNEPCRKEIAKLNALIEHIEDDLLLGTPVNWAVSDAGKVPTGVVGEELWPKERVWVGGLLCGPDTIVLAAANHIPARKPKPPEIDPAKDVTITLTLPPYLRDVTAFEADHDGVKPFNACTVKDGKAVLKCESIASGRVFVLRRSRRR